MELRGCNGGDPVFRLTAFFLIAFVPIFAHVAAQTTPADVGNSKSSFSDESRFARLTITKQSSLVILRGTVESCKDKRDALKQVSSMEGVQEVEDHVEVKAKQVPDQSLTREIHENLKDHNFSAVRFRVSKGIITLRGTVPSDSDREQVIGLICAKAGVVDVDDHELRVLLHASK